ncbi:septum formation inhibitor Maf [Endozoicomonas sp. SM1973]|uniref:dTTP/UTP pyrophosphatase n=1 Tax=Spartinivicinus marinus TaxID=2994442 RepID=A0A853I9G7_9GAMM|nr:Maf family protein [Spartinivicinus marinus]MCX4028203.1 Maf family protein [Spartinivicinus marinus]NYZ68402.1 septum formation inhibitor Maf [Spartinivicinus marinus]
MDVPSIYLASQSPRRRELLEQIRVSYQVLASEVNETPLLNEHPQHYVERIAEAKAEAGWQLLKASGLAQRPVLAADTAVVLEGVILGKPSSVADAKAMLTDLSGKPHQVMTSVAVVNAEATKLITSITDVLFKPLTESLIDRYCATGEPNDKAGAYGIQGLGAILVAAIKGSYSGVVGLPLTETAALLAQFEVDVWQSHGV